MITHRFGENPSNGKGSQTARILHWSGVLNADSKDDCQRKLTRCCWTYSCPSSSNLHLFSLLQVHRNPLYCPLQSVSTTLSRWLTGKHKEGVAENSRCPCLAWKHTSPWHWDTGLIFRAKGLFNQAFSCRTVEWGACLSSELTVIKRTVKRCVCEIWWKQKPSEMSLCLFGIVSRFLSQRD